MIPLFKVFMHPSAAKAVADVLASGYIGQGALVDRFEAELEELFGAPVLTVNSCTSALDLALHLIGVGPGDHVITTAQTCTATNGVIVRRGAIPVWADVDPVTGLLDPKGVDAALGWAPNAKAIMAVDWGGAACDYANLKGFGIPVVEDAAHALGALYRGQPIAQTGGDYVCWSFQAIKHLTTGDGGALKTPPEQHERARKLRWYGLDRRSKASFRCEQNIEEVGYKYHMNDIAAAIGLANVGSMREIVRLHRENARLYETRLKRLSGSFVARPPWSEESAWWLYTLRVEDRPAFIRWMAARGVEASPVHARNDRHTAFAAAAAAAQPDSPPHLPWLDAFAGHAVAIPVGWWLRPEELERIVQAVTGYAEVAAQAALGRLP